MPEVNLTDLETIRRFSLATRGETADLEEVVAALRADLDALTAEVRPKKRAAKKAAKKSSSKKSG